MNKKELLFSVTKDDFEVQTFRSGGNGGQHQNKTQSGVRIIHKDSGAVGESREHKEQIRNKRAAFERLVATKEFKSWHKLEVAKRTGELASIEQEVDKQMSLDNLKIEGRVNDKWEEIT